MIEYNYEITLVDKENKCLEVKYTAPGRETITVGVRYPMDGETLEDVIKEYSPVVIWYQQARTLSDAEITVGQTGTINPVA